MINEVEVKTTTLISMRHGFTYLDHLEHVKTIYPIQKLMPLRNVFSTIFF